jgi:hypothetical protein
LTVTGSSATVTINRLNFINGNISTNGGAISLTSSAQLTLNSCLLSNNKAISSGGAIHNNTGTLILNACVFYGNNSNNGGAIYNVGNSTIYANGCTFYNNRAQGNGGVIYGSNPGNVSHLTGNFFFGNKAGSVLNIIHRSGAGTFNFDNNEGYNIYDKKPSGTGITNNSPFNKEISEALTVVSPSSFRWLPDLGNAKIITDQIDGYPECDFYGESITYPAYPGAVQRPLVSPIRWKSNTTNNQWDNASNWDANLVPEIYTDVEIPSSSNYPVLTKASACKDIFFEAGAELGRQDRLTYATAHVDYALESAHRYYMLAVPLQGIKSGDFYLGGTPAVYMKEYHNTDDLAAWQQITQLEHSLPLGAGFGLRVADDVTIKISGSMAGENVRENLLFGTDTQYGNSAFALAANPFMTSIDFTQLIADNPHITSNYLIWNDTQGHIGYTPDGEWGGGIVNGTEYGKIAPLQSFFIEQNTSGNYELVFDIATLGATGSATLRSAAVSGNKLNIVASNEAGSILTFIANREYGQPAVSNRDARKLLPATTNLPDIYTLKDSDSGVVALGANIINTNDAIVPLGLSTAYTGAIQLEFSGMDSYNANITLIDMVENQYIDISDRASFSYSFENNVNPENRFYIQFTPKTITGIEAPAGTQGSVYSRNGMLHAVAGTSGLIRQIWVYDLQGKLVYADKNIDAPAHIVNAALPAVCVVKLITEKGVKNVKLINK